MLQTPISGPNRPLHHIIPAAASADCLATIEALGTNHRFEADRPLFLEGDHADYCYKTLSGAVRACKLMPDGRRQVTDFFLPGSLIGFDFATRRGFTAEAIVESVIRRYPKPSIDRLVDENTGMAQQLLSLTIDRLASAQKQALVLGCKRAMERLAGFLFAQAGIQAENRFAGATLTLPMSRLDIADYLGLTVETVSRRFTKLRHDWIIELPTAHCVVIRDWDALEDLCAGIAV
jgi:CRP-like cAMP-binding protein